jgi:hypothetical protein
MIVGVARSIRRESISLMIAHTSSVPAGQTSMRPSLPEVVRRA